MVEIVKRVFIVVALIIIFIGASALMRAGQQYKFASDQGQTPKDLKGKVLTYIGLTRQNIPGLPSRKFQFVSPPKSELELLEEEKSKVATEAPQLEDFARQAASPSPTPTDQFYNDLYYHPENLQLEELENGASDIPNPY